MIANGQHVFLLRPAMLEDSFGDLVPSPELERKRLNRATVKRGSATDLKDLTGHAVATAGTLYVEAFVEVRKDDVVEELDGTRWEVTGEGVRHAGFLGRHTVASLKRITA